jgi:hypothetical protein
MADAQQMQLGVIIKQLEKLNETMGVIAKDIKRYVDMIGNLPAKTNV